MTDHPLYFETSPPEDWLDRAQFGSLVPKAAHRIARLVSADHDRTIGDTIAAALVNFATLSPAAREASYADIAGKIGGTE